MQCFLNNSPYFPERENQASRQSATEVPNESCIDSARPADYLLLYRHQRSGNPDSIPQHSLYSCPSSHITFAFSLAVPSRQPGHSIIGDAFFTHSRCTSGMVTAKEDHYGKRFMISSTICLAVFIVANVERTTTA